MGNGEWGMGRRGNEEGKGEVDGKGVNTQHRYSYFFGAGILDY
jgi:hypothetical protein